MANHVHPEAQKWALLLDRLAQRTHNINLFFDCCHSGTITRVMPEEEGAEDRVRWLPPPPGSCAVPGPATPLTTRAVLPSLSPGQVFSTPHVVA